MREHTYPPPVEHLHTLGMPRTFGGVSTELLGFDEPEESEGAEGAEESAESDEGAGFPAMEREAEEIQNRPHVPHPFAHDRWPDYRAGGIGPEHIPDLIRLVEDHERYEEYDPETPAVYVPLHAWRALGQLRAEEAIRPLRGLLEPLREDDWFQMEVPEVFGMIGAAAVAPLVVHLADPRNDLYTRSTAATGIAAVGRMHPDARAESVAALVGRLEASLDHPDPDDDLVSLNGFLVADLLDLGAAEALPTIRRVAEADSLDESISGDMEDIEIGFGVREARDTPRPRYNTLGGPPGFGPGDDPYLPGGGGSTPKPTAANKEKRKQKAAKESRRKNRKKR